MSQRQTTLPPRSTRRRAFRRLSEPARGAPDGLDGTRVDSSLAPAPGPSSGDIPVSPSYSKRWIPPRTQIVGGAITIAGLMLALVLLYLYVFSALTAARNQNELLHSFTGNAHSVFDLASGHAARNGEPVAILNVPAIGVHQAVVDGTTAADLQLGPGLVANGDVPGETGDAIIAGRRVSFGGPFSRLSSLKPGNRISVADGAGAFEFSVVSVENVSRGSVSVPSYGRSWLTLVTSNSAWLPDGRTVVLARIVGQPVASRTPSQSRYLLPSFAGDPAAGILAALWALASVAVLVVMIVSTRRWRQTWLSWLLGAPVLLVCGLFACESLARCLPSTL